MGYIYAYINRRYFVLIVKPLQLFPSIPLCDYLSKPCTFIMKTVRIPLINKRFDDQYTLDLQGYVSDGLSHTLPIGF